MKILLTLFLVLLLTTTAFAAKPGTGCSGETPLSWSFIAPPNGEVAALSNDDPARAYVQGVDGVVNSLIQGLTGDATIAFPGPGGRKPGRSLRVQIPSAIPGSMIEGGPVPFAGGDSFLVQGQMVVRNILGLTVLTPGQPATFYTRASGTFVATDGKKYQWASLPDGSTCPGDLPCVPDFTPGGYHATTNQPEQTAWVKVTFTPRSATNPDQWLVEGLFVDATNVTQRSTMMKLANGQPAVHQGQYSLPFKIQITALCPLN